TFNDGASALATVAISGGQATFTTAALALGSHSITAIYSDDNAFNDSTSAPLTQTVNLTGTKINSSTAVTSSVNPSAVGQSVTFTATVTGAGTPTGSVTFKDGTTTLGTGTLSSGQATFSTSALTLG